MDNNRLAHTKWNCKYHIVFTPKYRRQIIYKQISADIGQIIRTFGSYPSLRSDTAKVQRVGNRRISQRKEQFNDIRPTSKPQVQVW